MIQYRYLLPWFLQDYGQGSAQLIIDLRSRSRYHHRHIPGSHSIPSGRLISGEPPEGDLILVGETTLHSAVTLEQLHAQGYARRIRHLADGFEAWRQLGLPVAQQQRGIAPSLAGEWVRMAVSGLLFGPWGRSRSLAGLALARSVARLSYGGEEEHGILERFDANSSSVITDAMSGHDVGRDRSSSGTSPGRSVRAPPTPRSTAPMATMAFSANRVSYRGSCGSSWIDGGLGPIAPWSGSGLAAPGSHPPSAAWPDP